MLVRHSLIVSERVRDRVCMWKSIRGCKCVCGDGSQNKYISSRRRRKKKRRKKKKEAGILGMTGHTRKASVWEVE